jgi:hypothetical protein
LAIDPVEHLAPIVVVAGESAQRGESVWRKRHEVREAMPRDVLNEDSNRDFRG